MTAPCKQMNTCSQLSLKQEEEKGKTPHADMHLQFQMQSRDVWGNIWLTNSL